MWAGDHHEMERAVVRLAGEGVTVFDTAADALRALRALSMYREHQHIRGRDRLAVEQPQVDHARIAAARQLLESAGPALAEHPSKQLLALYGVGIPREEIADSAGAAAAAASRIGYPVALKIHSPEIMHKTEAGGLRLGLANAAQVKEAYAAVMANAAANRPDARLDGVLVAPMAAAGLEMIVGAYQDAEFGPVLLAGLGGVLVEVLRDTALRVAPVSPGQALLMLDELKGSARLDGARGQAAVDRAAVAGVLAALSTMMLELREWIAEVDINPLIVHADGRGATVADALVVLR